MTAKRKRVGVIFCCAILAVCTSGCGGLSASKSFSPASFLLPGLLKAEPKPVPVDSTVADPEAIRQVASVR